MTTNPEPARTRALHRALLRATFATAVAATLLIAGLVSPVAAVCGLAVVYAVLGLRLAR